MAFLEIERINAFYGVFQALFDVSLRLDEGEAVCLLGRNGAGKTTTLSSVLGLNHAHSGTITFKGTEITNKKPYEIARLGMGYAPENRLIFQDLTVRDNLELGCRNASKQGLLAALDKIYGLFPRLKDLEDRQGGTLSGGEQQMLTIGRALMGGPDLLLLDELTTGLAPIVVQLLKTQITRLKAEKLTILLTEQNALFALDICDRVYIIDKGTIVYEGSVQDLRQNRDLMRQYLGV